MPMQRRARRLQGGTRQRGPVGHFKAFRHAFEQPEFNQSTQRRDYHDRLTHQSTPTGSRPPEGGRVRPPARGGVGATPTPGGDSRHGHGHIHQRVSAGRTSGSSRRRAVFIARRRFFERCFSDRLGQLPGSGLGQQMIRPRQPQPHRSCKTAKANLFARRNPNALDSAFERTLQHQAEHLVESATGFLSPAGSR